MELQQMGVYAIVNTVNGKMYVGSARNMATRWNAHRHELRRGTHHSIRLQRAWRKYGADAFILQIMEVVKETKNLRAVEQRWIDFLNATGADTGYNMAPVAAGGHPVGWLFPLSARMKLSDGRFKGSGNVNAKLTDQDVKGICERYIAGESTYKLAKAYGVAAGTIQNIINGNTWKHVDAPRINTHHKGAHGARHHAAKLTDDIVVDIRNRVASGEPQASIAREYGIHQSVVSRLASGKRWRHVE